MQLKVIRTEKNQYCTIGKLYIDGQYFCDTLEDVDRGLSNDMEINKITSVKVYGKTAIPTGTYSVILSQSNRFKRILPEILNVPGWSGVRIHSGNKAEDTLGCILVGTRLNEQYIVNSRETEKKLLSLLQIALSKKDAITLEIV